MSDINQPIMDNTHITVMPNEVIEALNLKDDGVYLDATFGNGGHTRKILQSNPHCRVVAFDLDREAIKNYAPALEKEFGKRFVAQWANFSHCYKVLKKLGITKVDGVLADFGAPLVQNKSAENSIFTTDAPLDMRMSKAHHYFDAKYVVNKFAERELANILAKYGEEKQSRNIARAIVKARTNTPFSTTKQLADLVQEVVAARGYQRTHPASQTFKALRVFVNKEKESIELFLKNITPLMTPGSRLVCMSSHSLEDRIVKYFFRDNSAQLCIITRKPLVPSEQEIEENKASRSAKLRIAQKN